MFGLRDNHKFIGLDIGHSHLSAVRLKNDTVVEVGEYPLAEGIIDKGQVKDIASLAETIKRFWDDMGLKTKQVQFALCTPKTFVTTLNVPLLENEEELKQVVRFNIADRLSYDIEEAVIDYTLTEDEATNRDRDRDRLIVAAAPKYVVNDYISAVRRARLDILGIQLIPFALPHSILANHSATEQDSIDILCHIGSDITSIGIIHKRDCLFARFSPLAGKSITDKIQKELDLPVEEAERLKCALGVSESPKNEQEGRVQTAISSVIDTLGQEIHETVSYYQDQEDHTSYPVAQLLLSGGSAYLKGLPQYLEAIFSINVKVVEPRQGLTVHEEEFFARWALAYGLARTYKGIEKVQKPQKKKKESNFFSLEIAGHSLRREQ